MIQSVSEVEVFTFEEYIQKFCSFGFMDDKLNDYLEYNSL